jgi:hypothetical protein
VAYPVKRVGSKQPATAPDLLERSLAAISNRAAERDRAGTSERSMACVVQMFNIWRGTRENSDLTERDGWMFMVFLKQARCRYGKHQIDDYVDGPSYFALAGEAAEKEAAAQVQT